MGSVTIYDCEFLTAPGAPQRFWSGPTDPDPLVIQIGAVRLSLEPPYLLSDANGWLVTPVDRDGNVVALHPLVTKLTGITDDAIEKAGVALDRALIALNEFSEGDTLIAWGKDELLTLAASLFVQNKTSVIPVHRFRNAVPLVVASGEPADVVENLRSHTICRHFGLPETGSAHDARSDALSVARVFQYLLNSGRLDAHHFDWPKSA